jgi:hypothetical protein
MREHYPKLLTAHEAAPDGRSVRRIVRELQYDDNDEEVDDGELAKSESEAYEEETPVVEVNLGDSPLINFADFGLGCSKCEWKSSCRQCREMYAIGRRRIAEKKWSKHPVAPPTEV